jgi:hypothetical protein
MYAALLGRMLIDRGRISTHVQNHASFGQRNSINRGVFPVMAQDWRDLSDHGVAPGSASHLQAAEAMGKDVDMEHIRLAEIDLAKAELVVQGRHAQVDRSFTVLYRICTVRRTTRSLGRVRGEDEGLRVERTKGVNKQTLVHVQPMRK